MKKTGKTEQPRQSAEERRDAILDAAVIEFAAYGLHGASTEAIAQRVGISQPYIFRLFGTKKELFRDAVDRVVERILATFRQALAVQPHQPLQAMGLSFRQLINQRDELTLLLHAFAAARDPEIREVAQQRLTHIVAFVAEQSQADFDEIHDFLAHGMLMMMACALELPEQTDLPPLMANLLQPPRRWRADMVDMINTQPS